MAVIGLVGFIGSGKNTFAQQLCQHGCVQDSFAAPLKDLVSSVFGWPRHLLEGDTDESRDFRETTDIFWSKRTGISGFTPRLAMQLIGTDVMRDHFHKDIWLNSLEYRLRCRDHNVTVVSDARFRNELDLIKRMGGVTVWVRRGELPEWHDVAVKANSGSVKHLHTMKTVYSHVHSSEWEWCGYQFDHVIDNNSTVAHLYHQAQQVMQHIAMPKQQAV